MNENIIMLALDTGLFTRAVEYNHFYSASQCWCERFCIKNKSSFLNVIK